MSSKESDLDDFELFDNAYFKTLNTSSNKNKNSMKRNNSSMEGYDNNDNVKSSLPDEYDDSFYAEMNKLDKKLVEDYANNGNVNIHNSRLPHEYDDSFYREMDKLDKKLIVEELINKLTEMNKLDKKLIVEDNAKFLTKIIKELTEKINEKIKFEEKNIIKSKNKGYPTQNSENTIIRYKNNLSKLKKLNDEQKSNILEIYNNVNIHKDDKRNAINAIINGDKVMNSRASNFIPVSISNRLGKSAPNLVDKSVGESVSKRVGKRPASKSAHSSKKPKLGGKKSNKKQTKTKKNIKSKK